ncbi:MAG TPA: glycosyltransferase family 4 protein [Candidatus Limnocylindrales bacterium]|nr:glycosyltransferase family 4 protein [Candidatus Limnocylindrales bacterium]
MDKLHVALVAPPWFEIPPARYGGIEEVVAGIASGLVDRGHQVTVIDAGQGDSAAEHLHTQPESQADHMGEQLPEMTHVATANRLIAEIQPDIVHDHTFSGPLSAGSRKAPTIHTTHGPLTTPMAAYYRQLEKSVALAAISHAQRGQAPDLNWVGVVYNGVDVASFPLRENKEPWVLFIGRMHPIKGAHLAIDAARAAGRRIVLAGKVHDPPEHDYFEQEVRPRLSDDVQFVGEADRELKRELYGKAACVLFPSQWPEPFGMVMVEAMACGTPVVALRGGAVEEVVADGRTGLICDSVEQLPHGIEEAARLRPADCRRHVQEHFDVPIMAAGYERLFHQVIAKA